MIDAPNAGDAGGADRSGRRRSRLAQPRSRQVRLVLSDDELGRLRELAGGRGISVQRMLVEDALAGRPATAAAGGSVDALVGELVAVRRQLERVGNNLNQLARHANEGPEASMTALIGVDLEMELDAVRQLRDEVRAATIRVGGLR